MKMKNITLIAGIFLYSVIAQAENFKLTSQTVKPNAKLSEEQVFNGFGCSGKNISPDLKWTAGPKKDTKSYAVTVYDPDAPTGSGWWHWVVYNIPANVMELPVGASDVNNKQLPQGAAQGRTDFGTHAFGGACPPKGDKPHRYIFTVFALKTEKIEVAEDASAALIGFMLNANKLAKASFTAKYNR
jgi:Raf kinase inhibitor-like YbhB/YbcL family protein